MKNSKINKLYKMQVHKIKKYSDEPEETTTVYAFPRKWDKKMISHWLYVNGIENIKIISEYEREYYGYSMNLHYKTSVEFRKNHVYVTDYYDC
ncbi:hypothetical protein IC213_18270 [Clostridioides sp. ES-S-0049-02]|uniref:hypothetical protein n=1 Tax=Clostridioides sp. ES-S-0049-02 TaxID=2770778 RepID=UPI001D12B46B|nr:hypothetical protein [Clostridioides sp. ES-S-0049-02]